MGAHHDQVAACAGGFFQNQLGGAPMRHLAQHGLGQHIARDCRSLCQAQNALAVFAQVASQPLVVLCGSHSHQRRVVVDDVQQAQRRAERVRQDDGFLQRMVRRVAAIHRHQDFFVHALDSSQQGQSGNGASASCIAGVGAGL